MNRFVQVCGLIAAFILGSGAGAMALQWPGGEQAQIEASPAFQPSPEADLIYHILVGELAGKRGQLDTALENYRAAADSNNDPRLSERAVGIALFLKDHAAALTLARRWRQLDPENAQTRQALVLALLRSKMIEEAADEIDALRMAAGNADSQEGFTTIGMILKQVEDKDAAFEVMRTIRARHPESRFAQYYFALAALAKDEKQQALEALNVALSQQPDWIPVRLLRTQVMIETGDSDKALDDLAQAVASQPDNYALRKGYARMLIGARKLEDAQGQFKWLVEKDPEDVDSLYALGLLASEAKQFDEAEHYLLQVLRLGARIMDVYFELGKVEELRGNYALARDWYARVDDTGRYLNAQIRAAKMQARLGDFSAMAEQMAVLRRDNPQDAVALYATQAEILRDEGRSQEAFELLSQALEEYPDDHDLLYSRALIAEKLGHLDLLERDLHVIIAADPDNGHALNALGYTLADRTDRYQEALGYLEKAIVLLPKDAAVLDSMGWVKYRLGDYQEALNYLRQAYDASPDAEIAAHLSEVLWVSGQQEEARSLWRQATEKNPQDEHLLEVKGRLGL